MNIEDNSFLEGLNPEQREAVLHEEGPKLLVAVAGSGKTHSVVSRIARLIKVKGIDPGRILAVTFSKKGADEMNERLKSLIGKSEARVGTFHSVALQIHKAECIGSFDGSWDWTIDSRDRYRLLLKEVTGYKHMNWKKADIGIVSSYIEKCKSSMARPMSDESYDIAKKMFSKNRDQKFNPALLHESYELAEEFRKERRMLTFSDMLFDVVEAMGADDDMRSRWASQWDWVIQDEAQDQSLPQLVMGSLLARDHRNYVLVGDPSQCHPPGTMIESSNGLTPIERLTNQDTVSGWNRKSQEMIEGRKVEVGSRHYDGPMYSMHVGSRSLSMTDNHKVLCRWTDRRDRRTRVTYLMYRTGFGYRVGCCQLFSSADRDFNLLLLAIARLEKADSIWILKTHGDQREASIYKSIVASKYGIPTTTFEPASNNKDLDSGAIGEIFGSVDTGIGGINALRDNGCDVDYPFWPWPPQEVEGKDDDSVEYRRSTFFPVYACNLIPGLMSVPLPEGRNTWAKIDSVTSRRYSGPVYSLDVEKDHSYAANGIVVLNCIYTWRGARPEKLLGFEKDWNASVIRMGRNYRCGSNIVDIANMSLDAMDPSTRLDVTMICEKGTKGTVTSTEFNDLDDEGYFVSKRISELTEDGVNPRDIAILYRTNAQSRSPEENLISRKIPYQILGSTNFYERREIKNLLAYLRVASGYGDFGTWLESMEQCINTPFRFLGRRYVDVVKDVAKSHARDAKNRGTRFSWVDVIGDANTKSGIQSRQRASSIMWANMIEGIRANVRAGGLDGATTQQIQSARPSGILNDIVRLTKYQMHLVNDDGEESTENSRVSNVREMIRSAERFTTVHELLDYVEKTIMASREGRGKKTPNKVTLCSIHVSKGREWPVVFVIGCADGILPHGRAEDIEEERRLFYVASTRPKDELHYSYAKNIAIGNRIVPMSYSGFLDEVQREPSPVAKGGIDREFIE